MGGACVWGGTQGGRLGGHMGGNIMSISSMENKRTREVNHSKHIASTICTAHLTEVRSSMRFLRASACPLNVRACSLASASFRAASAAVTRPGRLSCGKKCWDAGSYSSLVRMEFRNKIAHWIKVD